MNTPQMHSGSASVTGKACDGCGIMFAPARAWQRFCGDSCRTEHHRKAKLGPDGRLLELERSLGALADKVAELEQRVARLDDPTRVPALGT